VDILAQSGIDGRLVLGMPAFKPFQNIGVKPQGHMPFDGTIEFAPYCACPVEDFRDVGKIYVLSCNSGNKALSSLQARESGQ
jgi:hypothetical protein